MFSLESYHTTLEGIPEDAKSAELVERVYKQVFRTDFIAPGFAHLRFRHPLDSHSLRRFMITMKDSLDTMYQQKRKLHLNCRSMLRFDQQTTTKFHLDGAPDESYLMLGYEPSQIQSTLCLADYARAAYDLKLTPQQFLTEYNPMFASGEQKLAPYTTRVEGFDTRSSHLLLINNSRLPFRPDRANTLGVMHQAAILNPDPSQSRIVNSIMLSTSETEDDRAVAVAMQQEFLTASPSRAVSATSTPS